MAKPRYKLGRELAVGDELELGAGSFRVLAFEPHAYRAGEGYRVALLEDCNLPGAQRELTIEGGERWLLASPGGWEVPD